MKISREVRIGFFVVVVVTGFVWSYSFLKGRNLFMSVKEYHIIYDKVNGLVESNPVTLNGFKIGQVSYVGLTSDRSGLLHVKIWLDKDYPVPRNSVAQIYSADLMGSKAIRIIPSSSAAFLASGDTLRGDIEGSLQEQVSIEMLPLKNKAENLLLSIDSVMAVIQVTFNEDFRKNFSVSFEKIRSTIASLNRSVLTLDTLISSKDGSIAQILADTESISSNIEENKDKLVNTIRNLSAISDSIASSDLRATIDNLNKTLGETQSIMAKINQGEGTMGLLVTSDSLYRNLEGLTREMELLLNDLRENPRRYVHFSLIGSGKDKNKEKAE